MHIVTAGQGDPPIVFVHGFACDSSDWSAQLDWFKASNRFIACDLPGHGDTEGEAEECSIETFGGAVAHLLTTHDLPPAVLVGHSMGCRVVLQTYLDAPDRVAGIVLVDGSLAGAGSRTDAEQALTEQLRTQGYEGFVRGFFQEMFLPTSDPALKSRIVDRALNLPAATGAALFTRLVGWDAAVMRDALDSVRVPMMVIQSTALNSERVRVPLEAGHSSPWLDLVRRQASDTRIEVLPEEGHFPHIEASVAVNLLIADFIAGLP